MDSGSVSLAELLTSLVDDLYSAETERVRKGRAGKVMVEQVGLELKATLSREGSAGLRFHILGAEFGGKKETVSTIRVTLAPRRPGMEPDAAFLYTRDEPREPSAPGEREAMAWQRDVRVEALRTSIARLIERAAKQDSSRESILAELEQVLETSELHGT